MSHNVSVEVYDDSRPIVYFARCKCRWTGKQYINRHDAEDEARKHDEQVQRVLAHLGPKNPSLKGQRDYYRQMADDESVPEGERALWKQLADELEPRVGDRAEAQDGLW